MLGGAAGRSGAQLFIAAATVGSLVFSARRRHDRRHRGGVDAIFTAQQRVNNASLTLTKAKRRLAGTTITAPIAGRVLSVGGTVGSAVSPGGTGFVVLGDVSGLQVQAQFSEADVGRLAVGQAAKVTLPAGEGEPTAEGDAVLAVAR